MTPEPGAVGGAVAPAAARTAEQEAGDLWSPRPWVDPAARAEAGRAARKRVPRVSHATFEPGPGRDPIVILNAQEADRLPDLVPVRHARMASSPLAYYRGTPAVMAFDLATTPRTDIRVQACGDAHLSNFALFASPERTLVFDVNDFDETLPGPWEWDVKRLAASIVVAGLQNGFSASQTRSAAMATVAAYRSGMTQYAGMGLMDVWYSRISAEDIRADLAASPLGRGSAGAGRRRGADTIFAKARQRDQLKAFGSLTRVVDGRRVIVDDPPIVEHESIEGGDDAVKRLFGDYRATLPDGRRDFLERYRFVEAARKVVGVGSVGTRCFVIVLEGRDGSDPLILQAKEAPASVLDPYVGPTVHANQGQRVVAGQRAMQATPDILLGWTRGPDRRDYYFRQLWDQKGSVDIGSLEHPVLGFYGALCGRSLARAHARTGDSVAIAGYLGTSDTFDGAIADFAEAYAHQNAQDHAAYLAAIRAGRIAALNS